MKAIITGASKGIGQAITELLLQNGWSVVGISRTTTIDHPNYDHLSLDLTNFRPEEVKGLTPDALIHSAGMGYFGKLEQLDPKKVRALFELNFFAPFTLTKALLPQMKQRGSGDLIFLGSEAALQGKKEGSAYCSSKFALRGFVQSLRDECRTSGVRTTLINPGPVKTPFFDDLHFQPGENENEHIRAEDVAQAVWSILNMREGTCVEEISLQPQKPTIVKGSGRSPCAPPHRSS